MKKAFTLCALFVIHVAASFSQTFTPIATSGYNIDAIAESGSNSLAQTTQALDWSNNVMYNATFATSAALSCGGIVNNGTIVSGTRTYQIMPFTGNNAFYVATGNTGTLTLNSPAQYTNISLMIFATEGGSNINVTFKYSNATTTNFGSFAISDWFFASGAVYAGFGRCTRVTAAPTNDGCTTDPRFYNLDFALSCADQAKNLQSIIINTTSGNQGTYVMAVSGAAFTQTNTVTPVVNVSCNGGNNGSATANATGSNAGFTYSWNTLPVQTTALASNLSAGNYTCTITDAKGCTSTTTVAITQPPALTLSLTTTNASCGANNGSIVASGGGGTPAYNFSSNGGAYSTTSNFTNLGSGTYSISIKDSKGCITNSVTVIGSSTSPAVSVNSGSVCAGKSLTLTANGATTYSWSPATGLSATSGSVVVATPSVTTTYTVVGSTGICTGSAVATVTVNAIPTTTASNNGPVCAGQSLNLNSGTGASYSWSGPGGFSSATQNPVIASTSASNSGVYTVTVTSANGCTNTATSSATINPIPNPVVGSNSPVCVGSNINLTASGGTSYAWSGPAGYTSAVQNPTIASAALANSGVYTASVSALGCSATGTVNVTVTTATTSASNTGPYCAGITIQLSASAATSYTWSGPGGFSSNAQNPTITASTAAMTGSYTVTVTIGSCTATASTMVTVNALPTPTASNTGPYCPGNTIQLNVPAASTYTWSGPAAFSSNTQNPSISSASVANGGTYTVAVKDGNGCSNTATTSVTVNPATNPVVGGNSPVCVGSDINLTASGGTSYSWSGPAGYTSAVQNPTITAATLANSGIYTVTATTAGCSATGTVNITVTTATTSASNTGPYCAGTTIQLNAPAATSYTWSGPSGFSSNTQNPTIMASTAAMSGNYTILVTIGSCTATASTSVTVNALPAPTASNTGPYCPGNTIQLNVTAASTYTWSGPGGFSSNTQNPSVSNAAAGNAGTYSITVTDMNGCVGFDTVAVVVNPAPVPVVGSNSPVCQGSNITLTATGGTSYSWSGPTGFTSATQNPSIANATTANSGIYTVTATALGCTGTGTTSVIVATPTISVSNVGPYCSGSSIQLNAPAASSYTWTGPGGFVSNAQNPTRAAATPGMSGTYTLVVAIGSCTATASTSVTVNPLPTPTASNAGPYCPGGTVQLNVSAASSYTWSGPAAFSSNVQNPSVASATGSNAGTYTVAVTDLNGCTNNTTTAVVVNAQPVVSASGATVCQNAGTTLGANGGTSYTWSGPGGFTSNLQNPNIPNASAASAGQYTVVVSDVNTCTNTAVCSLAVTPLPVPAIQSNSPVCLNATLNLSGSGGVSYNWVGPNGFSSSSQNPSLVLSSMAYSGNYSLTVTSAGGCSASTSASVTINPLPVVTISSGPNTGCIPMCVTFSVSANPALQTYNWNLGNGSSSGIAAPQSCYNAAGVYTISTAVTDVNGCPGSATYTVQAYPLPEADFSYSPNQPIENADEVTFTDVSYGATITSWKWNFMNDLPQDTSNARNPSFLYTDAGQYNIKLIVKSDKGCLDTMIKTIIVGQDFGIYIPNAFTPNDDGLNDVFYASGFGITSFTMDIFDRWGEKIFSSNDIHAGWDGSYQGRSSKPVQDGVYIWQVKVINVFGNKKEMTGHVTLLK